ncbi:MAG: phosphotransferase [Candidatus Baldrarchaeia archaeon]|mgnify:CR=1 FL=1
MKIRTKELERYLSEVHKRPVRILSLERLGGGELTEHDLKGYGYGQPILIRYKIDEEERKVVLQTLREDTFGHDFFSDRAQILLWAHSAYNKLPRHVRSIDVGAFTREGRMISLGDAEEFFLMVEYVEGELYHKDLDRIKEQKALTALDLDRARALSDYLVGIHSKKLSAPHLYIRRIRDLIGHGECIMGLIDNYPEKLDFTSEDELKKIEKLCVEWRWKLKKMTHRLSQVHGDFHPWNVMFREGTDFIVLDRSRGEWGEPADDLTAMSINYLFYSLQTFGKMHGPFEKLWVTFIENYLQKTEDYEILSVVQPFYAWRGLVVASPIWYPTLPFDVRRKLFNFIVNVLESDEFDYKRVNSYLE